MTKVWNRSKKISFLLVLISAIFCYISYFAHAGTSWPVKPYCFEEAQLKKIQYIAYFFPVASRSAYNGYKRMVFMQLYKLLVTFKWHCNFILKNLYEWWFFIIILWKSDSVRCFFFYFQQPASDLRKAKNSHGRGILYHASIIIKVIKSPKSETEIWDWNCTS